MLKLTKKFYFGHHLWQLDGIMKTTNKVVDIIWNNDEDIPIAVFSDGSKCIIDMTEDGADQFIEMGKIRLKVYLNMHLGEIKNCYEAPIRLLSMQ